MSILNFEMAVRVELAKRKMTMVELARQAGISADYTRKIINGKRKAPARREQIKKILHMEVQNEKKQKQEDGDRHDHQGWDRQDLGRSQMVQREAV